MKALRKIGVVNMTMLNGILYVASVQEDGPAEDIRREMAVPYLGKFYAVTLSAYTRDGKPYRMNESGNVLDAYGLLLGKKHAENIAYRAIKFLEEKGTASPLTYVKWGEFLSQF